MTTGRRAGVAAALLVASGCAATPSSAPAPASIAHRGGVASPPPLDLARLAVPAGFRAAAPDDAIVELFAEPHDPERLGAWVADGVALAAIQTFRRAAAAPSSVEAWARTRAAALAGDGTPVQAIQTAFDYLVAWEDEGGRRHAEWAWVGKGERIEWYDRLVDDGVDEWHVRLQVNGEPPPEVIRPWLAALFDAPFGTPPPAARRAQHGRTSPR